MRKHTFIITIIGIFIGLIISLITYKGLHMTANDKFCVLCHEMHPMVASYETDPHGGSGKTGIKVSCVKCHLPQDNIIKYIYTKAVTGGTEVAIHFFGNPDDINWQEKRKERKLFVYDEACKNCHTTFKTNPAISKKGRQMHAHYTKLENTDKRISCASCHIEVGHKGLRTNINYYKPEYDFYKGKLDKYKEKVEKELSKALEKE